MKKVLAVAFLACLAMGCKGEKGDKGDRGITGLTGPSGSFELVSGSVSSNSFSVTDSRFSGVAQITVYVGDATSLSELPYFLPASGVNTYFIFKPNTNTVEIYNAQLAGATIYIIAVS